MDSIVKNLMSVERVPLNKLYQKKQLAEWRQEAYRNVISSLNAFKNTYFNVLSASNMLSPNSYIKYTSSSTNESIVTVSGNADSTEGTHKISVYRLATAAVAKSTSQVLTDLTGSKVTEFSGLSGKTINVR